MNGLSAVPPLDIFSVKAMALVTVLSVSLVALSAWKTNERIAGMRLFTMGLLALSFGAVLGIARVLISGNAIFVVCNVFMLGGMIAVVQGVRVFRGIPPLPRAAVAGLAAIVSVFYFWWMFGENNFGMRVGVISAAFALLSTDAAASMIRRVPACDRSIYWPTGFAFAFAASNLAMRAVGALSGYYGASLWSPVPIELASTICGNVAYTACAFGMLIASNAQLTAETEKMALVDPLTNLPNRRSFWERLVAAEIQALSTERKFGLIYLDLDEFKLINDMLGHHAGDDLLVSISAAMARMLRSGDCLGRIGGDEFVVLVEDVQDRSEVEGLAARLKATVESEAISGEFAALVHVSCGVAIFPENGCSAHDAMREADAAMYRAKQRKRLAEKTSLSTPRAAVSPGNQATDGSRSQDEHTNARPKTEAATRVSLQRRRSDYSRKGPQLPRSRFRSTSTLPGIPPESASPRFSWGNPLSWIGY